MPRPQALRASVAGGRSSLTSSRCGDVLILDDEDTQRVGDEREDTIATDPQADPTGYLSIRNATSSPGLSKTKSGFMASSERRLL